MDKLLTSVLDYIFAEPMRFLSFVILILTSNVLKNHLKNRKDEKKRIDDLLSNLNLIKTVIEDKTAENLSMVVGLNKDLREVVRDIGLLRGEIAAHKVDLSAKIQDLLIHINGVKESHGRVIEIKKDIDKQFGKVRIVEENYNKIINKFEELKANKK